MYYIQYTEEAQVFQFLKESKPRRISFQSLKRPQNSSKPTLFYGLGYCSVKKKTDIIHPQLAADVGLEYGFLDSWTRHHLAALVPPLQSNYKLFGKVAPSFLIIKSAPPMGKVHMSMFILLHFTFY